MDTQSQAKAFDDIALTLPNFQLDPRRAAVLVVDMQYYDCHPDFGFGFMAKERGHFDQLEYFYDRMWDVIVPAHQRLLPAARSAGIPVIYCKVGSQTPGGEDLCLRYRAFGIHTLPLREPRSLDILDEIKPEPNDIVLTKSTQNVFISTPIDMILRNLGIRQMIMTGVATNNCVESATRTATDLSYECFVVEDACGAYTSQQHAAAADNIDGNLGWMKRTDDLIDAMQRGTNR